jgi:hypothetical protein
MLFTHVPRKKHDIIMGELHTLYRSSDISKVIKTRKMKWAGYVARMWNEKCVKMSTYEKKPLVWPRRRLMGNIKMDLKETGCELD